ncbi:hypothetical protein LH128_18629 [Sphingomonas sp. LH128]|uniref:Peptidase M4 n=1 Tax=Novosphingobium resinovorum TaxID=158500 RepID=A0A031JPV9_9SPHN|nr:MULTISPECIES: hypothetical protein [Sphingomonadaceae]EJU11490.1 hypothetical protein LH128_18629 [Sphingomonas sp. LH128]EZP74755.1 hypothetical protein BV97_04703 [Novosphingobium resinovorum]
MTNGVVITVSPRVLREVRSAEDEADERKRARDRCPAADTAPGIGAETDMPMVRRMRIFAIDPTARSDRGGVVTVSEPYEPLEFSGDGETLRGRRFAVTLPVWSEDKPQWRSVRTIIDAMKPNSIVTIADAGYPPSLSDPRFIAQMVYATASQLYGTFRKALGREIVLGLMHDPATGEWSRADRFHLAPWEVEEAQAWFDPARACVVFGYYKARSDTVGYPPGSRVFTALSHDVIVHEMTHALLDAVKPEFMTATHRDVLAFHEAFADLVAIFQRYSYGELVAAQITEARGDIERLGVLGSLARTFSETAGGGATLRPLIGDLLYDSPEIGDEPHQLGNVLVQAVYRAFQKVAGARIEGLIAIATNGSGILPRGALSPALAQEIAARLGKTAQMFQSMLIRALDYAPPFGITFFTFLRAVISADMRLVPVDDENIRVAWMEAFRHHRIFPSDGLHYAEEQLAWPLPEDVAAFDLAMLSFAQTAFQGNPGDLLSLDIAAIQAARVAAHMNGEEAAAWQALLDLEGAGSETRADIVGLRSFARPGPGGMTEFGTVLEVVCRSFTDRDASGFMGATGASLVYDSAGRLMSCAIEPQQAGAVTGGGGRREDIEGYAVSKEGARSWLLKQGRWQLRPDVARGLCMR